jgi:hypothetical protein
MSAMTPTVQLRDGICLRASIAVPMSSTVEERFAELPQLRQRPQLVLSSFRS